MEKRELGRSGLLVSPISVGCWSFGGGSYWGEQSQKSVEEVVHTALDRGVNLFDSAESYNDGASEISLGKALGCRRDEAVIVTKQFITSDQDDTTERFEASLKRLNTDYVDVLMVHWPSNDRAVMERVFTRYEQLLQAGKIRAVGVSNFGVQQMTMMKELGFSPCVNELHYNIASRAIDHAIKPLCMENQIGIITYVSLQQGVLTGKYRTLDDIPPKQTRYRHFKVERCQGLNNHEGPGAEEELVSLLETLRKAAEEEHATMTELALGWALRQPGITSAIVGCRNLEQLTENLKSADYPMSDALWSRLTAASEPLYHKLGYLSDYLKPTAQSRVR